ncbi:phage head-tail adapter protein [Staphylococcus kloosii]|jgi:hypothetical protein|uniref:phage head-tail adapter protein n=1 Tax=Staphylococcus kloosii TaxID=29384 RepID=UPI000D1F1708|nr:phage head-tail adapter protein [Staphylococcus kloosii]MBF7022487.1 phage head-tail adapter protein [Staphylococcus kloosii]PTJ79254.1 phage head-tail adapter protein [Staphylococcus kloosii]
MTQTRRQFVTGADMRTPVTFYEMEQGDEFMPGEAVSKIYYQCFANVYPPSQKDLDMTDNKATISMVTWFPIGLEITNDMYFEIGLPRYKDKQFNITLVEDDTDNHMNIKIIGERSE